MDVQQDGITMSALFVCMWAFLYKYERSCRQCCVCLYITPFPNRATSIEPLLSTEPRGPVSVTPVIHLFYSLLARAASPCPSPRLTV